MEVRTITQDDDESNFNTLSHNSLEVTDEYFHKSKTSAKQMVNCGAQR